MKKQIIGTTLALALLCSSCATTGNPNAVMGGAIIGGSLGGAIGTLASDGGPRGSRNGGAIGTIIGTIAGAAIANAATTPTNEQPAGQVRANSRRNYNSDPSTYESIQPSSPVANLRIQNIRFIDDSRDQIISSGEQGKVIFEIMNEGNETAYEVVPIVVETTGMKNISISSSVMIEHILAGEGIKYTATITAQDRIKDGMINIHIGVTDAIGNEYDWQEFTLQTLR